MLNLRPKIIYLSFAVLSSFLFLCGEGPTYMSEFVNNAPDTHIVEKTLQKVTIGVDTLGNPTEVNDFTYSVSFIGVDIDGTIDSFTYRIDGGTWTGTLKKSIEGTFTLATATDVHSVEVYCTDDKGDDDPTPAKAIFSLTEFLVNKGPSTSIESGPANGMTTGPGVSFTISGSDDDGFVEEFMYSLDGGTPVKVTANPDEKAVIEFSIANGNTLSFGNHSISVYAIDNYGKEDNTPAARSFYVKDGFSPVIEFTAGPADGGAWFSKVDAVFAYGVTMSHYAGTLCGYSYAFDSETEFSDWSTASTITITGDKIEDGDHFLILKARDTGGAISQAKISFNAGSATFVEDVVLIDLCNSGQVHSNDELAAMFAELGYPVAYITDEYDDAFHVPGTLGKYKTAVIFTDNGYTFRELLYGAYVKAGGNIFYSSYNFVDNTSSSFRSEILGLRGAWDGYEPDTPTFAGSGIFDGLTISFTSNWGIELLAGARVDYVYSLLFGIDGPYTSYPRGVFADHPAPWGNVFSMAQSLRRFPITDENKATIKAIMDLVTGVTSPQ